MKFLLVNTNPAVKKIFNIAARKANIALDFVSSFGEIYIRTYYDYIFIDDGVFDIDSFQNIKSKMIATKFCLILSKNSEMIPGFDGYIRKPFLPTDIYEVLKQEKHSSDMNFSSFETEAKDDIVFDTGNNLDDSISRIDLLDEIDDSSVDVNINNIDLSEFDDNDDEFLSGIKDNMSVSNPQNSEEIMIRNNLMNDSDEIKFTYDDVNASDDDPFDILNSPSSPSSSSNYNSLSISNSSSNIVDDGIDIIQIKDTTSLDSTNKIQDTTIPSNKNNANQYDDVLPDIITDTKSNAKSSPSSYTNNYTSSFASSNDDIDFSSIFAMQDEFLKDQNQDKPKGIIGGDIYTPKEHNLPDDSALSTDNQNLDTPKVDVSKIGRMKLNISQESIDNKNDSDANHTEMLNEFDELDELGDIDFYDDLNLLDKDFRVEQNDVFETKSDYQNLNDDFNIGELSDEELDNLDDEALLKLQEESTIFSNEPKILNKNDIAEVTHILEDTKKINTSLDSGNTKIADSGLDSATKDAFSEVNLDDDLSSLDDATLSETMGESEISNQSNIQEPPADTIQELPDNINDNVVSPVVSPSIDLTEIVKSFPVDKLRELLSGVQITINITFPTKK